MENLTNHQAKQQLKCNNISGGWITTVPYKKGEKMNNSELFLLIFFIWYVCGFIYTVLFKEEK